MPNETSARIVVENTTANQIRVFHRDFPEIRAEGPNAQDAAAQLSNELTRALDSALTTWRRETLDKAVADVQAFVDSSR